MNSTSFPLGPFKRSPSFKITAFLWVFLFCVAMGVMSPIESFIVLWQCLQGPVKCSEVSSCRYVVKDNIKSIGENAEGYNIPNCELCFNVGFIFYN